jgi:hypothetical protein
MDLAELFGPRRGAGAMVIVLRDGKTGGAQHQDEDEADNERLAHGNPPEGEVLFHAFG